MLENRKYARFSCNLRCWCEGDNVTVYARVGNLSENGLFLRMGIPLNRGAHAIVRFALTPHVQTAARVAWSQVGEQDSPLGMGLQFETADTEIKEAIRSIVDAVKDSTSAIAQ